MRLTQGAFSFLPDLTDEQIANQVRYALDNDLPISIESSDDPHPRNSYWEMYGLPKFDVKDAAGIMDDIRKAIAECPNSYVKVNAYDPRLGLQTTALSFIGGRPAVEPGFRLDRIAGPDLQQHDSIHSYATERPTGERYDTPSKNGSH